MASQGLRRVRLIFNWSGTHGMQPTLGGALDPGECSRLLTEIGNAHAAGIKLYPRDVQPLQQLQTSPIWLISGLVCRHCLMVCRACWLMTS